MKAGLGLVGVAATVALLLAGVGFAAKAQPREAR